MKDRAATLFFALLILAGFGYQLWLATECCATNAVQALSATSFEEVLLASGGALTTMSLETEWWRLGTSMFVHAGVIHLLANLLALLQIGYLLESLFGTPAMFASFVISGIVAALATILLANGANGLIYVGASGPIFGIAGTLVVGSRRIWLAEQSRWSRRLTSRLIGCIAINLIFGVLISAAASWAGLGFAIANTAHVAGLLVGLLLGLLPLRLRRNERTAVIMKWFDPPPPDDLPPA